MAADLAAQAFAQAYAADVPLDGVPLPPRYADDQLTEDFTATTGAEYTYVPEWAGWYHRAPGAPKYDPDVARCLDAAIRLHLRARAGEIMADRAIPESARGRIAAAVAAAKTVSSVERLARCDARHVRRAHEFDADPDTLNTPAGVFDLRDGSMRPHAADDLHRMCTLVAPATAPYTLWHSYLHRIHTPETINYMQRVLGYCITGHTREHAMWFFFGVGSNGKSVLLRVLLDILGDYACVMPADLLLEARGERHPTGLASIEGRRLAIAPEIPDGRRWDSERVKSLTSGDPQTARLMRRDFHTFIPRAKLIGAGNHRPPVRTVDGGLRRRLRMVDFGIVIPPAERDPELGERLRSEYPAILQWLIDGAIAWRREGLDPPSTVQAASADYWDGQDVIGQWLADHVVEGGAEITPLRALHAAYHGWAAARGERFLGERALGQELADRGYERARSASARGFRGLTLRAPPDLAGGVQ